MKPKRGTSLYLVLALPFVILITSVAGITGYLSIRNGEQAINDLSVQLLDEIHQRINQHLNQLLEMSDTINQINSNTIDPVALKHNKLSDMRSCLFVQLQQFGALRFIGIGTEKGGYVGLERSPEKFKFQLLDTSTDGIAREWLVDSHGTPGHLISEFSQYDPRTRPWYQAAIKTRQASWSDIYLSFGPDEELLIISANRAIYNEADELIGVATNSISLTGLSDFLRQLQIGLTGQAFIMERNTLLVATSDAEPPFQLEDNQPRRLAASASNNPLLRSIAKYMREMSADDIETNSKQQLIINHQDHEHLARITPFINEFGLDWLIITILPEADVMTEINHNTHVTIVFIAIALAVAIILAFVIANWLVRPIKRLTTAAVALADGDWRQSPPSSGPSELKTLVRAFDHMATQLRDSLAALRHQAHHDGLTGLPNRTAFMEALKTSARGLNNGSNNHCFAVLFLDLDGFKLVNDSSGHLVGDELLSQVAHRLQNSLSDDALIARFGGDEFAILLPHLTVQEDALQAAEHINDALQTPFLLKNQPAFISASIGIVLDQARESSPECILRNADIAMYRAKANRFRTNTKTAYEFFDHSMHTAVSDRLHLETELKLSLQEKRFVIHYQPIADLTTSKLVGFEALIRWQHPQRGLLNPSQFLTIAEEAGLIAELDQWILHNVIRQIQQWQMTLEQTLDFGVSVNLSAQFLHQSEWISGLKQSLESFGLIPEQIKLEITENALINEGDGVESRLSELRNLGIQLCIDDFGTGYSSLSYLHRFPFTVLKIDRSFVQQMTENPNSQTIIKTIILLAKSLDMKIVAEGIETAAQFEQLRSLGCDYGQGYWFARPLSAEEAIKHIN